MGYFVFNGINSRDMGLTVERIPVMHSPKKRITSIAIPGRSGNLHQWDGSFENVTQSYQCWFSKPEDYQTLSMRVHRILEWLGTAPAGAELRDSYDDMISRRATYIGGAEIQNIRNTKGRFTISFDCDPRGFVDSNPYLPEVGSPVAALNPTSHYSLPLITVTCTGSGSVIFRARQGENILKTYTIDINFPDQYAHTITIDCDIKEAWGPVNGVVTSLNKWISTEEFPELWPGQNDIEVTGGISDASIEPRWWIL